MQRRGRTARSVDGIARGRLAVVRDDSLAEGRKRVQVRGVGRANRDAAVDARERLPVE